MQMKLQILETSLRCVIHHNDIYLAFFFFFYQNYPIIAQYCNLLADTVYQLAILVRSRTLRHVTLYSWLSNSFAFHARKFTVCVIF